MTLNQLEYFIAVAETLNFTKAAERCFISQAAITMQVRALEQDLGVPLFLRDRHHVELTNAGQIYLNEARAILNRAEESKKLIRTAAEGVSGQLNLGFIRGYEHGGFTNTIRDFRILYPNIRVNLERDNSSPLYDFLNDDKCDLIFNLAFNLRQHPEFNHYYLRSYPLYAVFYPRHPLSRNASVMYRELAGERFIIMQPEGRASDEAEESIFCFNRGGFVPNVVHREKDPQMVLFRVSITDGIAVLPEYCIRHIAEAQNLRMVPILKEDGTPETLDMEIIWKKSSSNPSLDLFLNWVREQRITE